MQRAQELLYLWIKKIGEVRYGRIKQSCEYLNLKLNLSLEKPVHDIFYPLFYNGVIEFIGDGKFHIAPECVISKNNNLNILVNSPIFDDLRQMDCIGIQMCNNIDNLFFSNRYNFNLESILVKVPSIQQCVMSYQEVYDIKIEDFVSTQGVSRKKNENSRWYFINYERGKVYTIPHQADNPDALNVAICYDRVVKQDKNGVYNSNLKELKMNIYHMPILIYRALMIESLFSGTMPYIENEYYIFKNISKRAYFELNRIFCKSIKNN